MTGGWQKKYIPKQKLTKVFEKENRGVKAGSLDKALDSFFRRKGKR